MKRLYCLFFVLVMLLSAVSSVAIAAETNSMSDFDEIISVEVDGICFDVRHQVVSGSQIYTLANYVDPSLVGLAERAIEIASSSDYDPYGIDTHPNEAVIVSQPGTKY